MCASCACLALVSASCISSFLLCKSAVTLPMFAIIWLRRRFSVCICPILVLISLVCSVYSAYSCSLAWSCICSDATVEETFVSLSVNSSRSVSAWAKREVIKPIFSSALLLASSAAMLAALTWACIISSCSFICSTSSSAASFSLATSSICLRDFCISARVSFLRAETSLRNFSSVLRSCCFVLRASLSSVATFFCIDSAISFQAPSFASFSFSFRFTASSWCLVSSNFFK
mmetsp:Transcript_625/g.2290  ORF Transcript_625/g.2290 Transcript_625/m.2290 type:complete len:231 (-) Transcript_625:293-985(-)